MSQSPIIICAVIAIMTAPASIAAQQNDTPQTDVAYFSVPVSTRPSVNYLNDINIRAVRHFKSTYKNASAASWMIASDCFRVSFDENNMHFMVDYDKAGNWRNTLRIFGERQLPADIRYAVKTTFPYDSIVTVTELTLGHTLAYFIKLDDGTRLKTIRLMDDEMETIEEFKK